MATAGERAAIGAEEARMQGRGPVGEAVDGAESAAMPGRTGFRGPRTTAGERAALGAEEARLEGRGPVGEAAQGAEAAARRGRTGVGAGVGAPRTTAGERAAIGAEEARLEGRGPVGEAAQGAEAAVRPGRTGVGAGVGAPRTTAGERAAIGAEDARLRGRGPVGEAIEGAEFAAEGRHGRRRNDLPGEGFRDGYLNDEERRPQHFGLNEGVRTIVSNEGEAYCPNPNIRDLPKEYETRVQVIQRYPEMRTVEKTDFVKEIVNEERTIIVPKTRVVMDEVQHVDRVPIIREVPKTRIEIVHRVVPEEREVTDMVPVIEYVDTPRIERVPRVIVEDIEERIRVPVVREVPVTRLVEVPTGNYCEAPAGEFVNPSHFNLLGHKHGRRTGGILNRTANGSASDIEEDVEHDGAFHTAGTHGHHGIHDRDAVPLETTTDATGTGLAGTGTGLSGNRDSFDNTGVTGTGLPGQTVNSNPTTPRQKRPGLLGRIIHH